MILNLPSFEKNPVSISNDKTTSFVKGKFSLYSIVEPDIIR